MGNDKRDADDYQQDAGPAHLRPKPEPIAFRMQRTRIGNRRDAGDRKDRLKISKTNSAPGRRPDQTPRITKNEPAKIARDSISRAVAQMKAFQRSAAKD